VKELILFALFLTVGIGVLIAGIVYMRKEKHDPVSVICLNTQPLFRAK